MKGNIALDLVSPWNTMQVAFAYHSKDQDVIVSTLYKSFDEDSMDWGVMSRLSIPIWLRDMTKLKVLVEKVAKSEHRN